MKKSKIVFGTATVAVITLGSLSEKISAYPNPRLLDTNFQLAQLGNCGSSKWQRLAIRDSWGGANFSSACIEHDRCYETLGKTKEECDRQFHATLRQECKNTYTSRVHTVQRYACLEIANTYYSAVNRMGKPAYIAAQREARERQERNPVVPPEIGVPDLMIQTSGYPVVAVFSERKESFALGCPEIRNMWSRIPVRNVSSQEYNRIQVNNPKAADLHCDGRIKAYAPTNEPGALLIEHTNGVSYRHYVDHPDFLAALNTCVLIPISASEFRTKFPERGTDFKAFR